MATWKPPKIPLMTMLVNWWGQQSDWVGLKENERKGIRDDKYRQLSKGLWGRSEQRNAVVVADEANRGKIF